MLIAKSTLVPVGKFPRETVQTDLRSATRRRHQRGSDNHLREVVPGRRRRAGADPVVAGPRVGPNHRALPGHEAGSGERAERRDQAEGGRVALGPSRISHTTRQSALSAGRRFATPAGEGIVAHAGNRPPIRAWKPRVAPSGSGLAVLGHRHVPARHGEPCRLTTDHLFFNETVAKWRYRATRCRRALGSTYGFLAGAGADLEHCILRFG